MRNITIRTGLAATLMILAGCEQAGKQAGGNAATPEAADAAVIRTARGAEPCRAVDAMR